MRRCLLTTANWSTWQTSARSSKTGPTLCIVPKRLFPIRLQLSRVSDAGVRAEVYSTNERLLAPYRELDVLAVRLSVRLGRENETSAAFLAAQVDVLETASALTSFYVLLDDEPDEPNDTSGRATSGHARERATRANAKLIKDRREFETAATALVRSRLADALGSFRVTDTT
jgi:hypothetical protein